MKTLEISASPQFRSGSSVDRIMRDVIVALIPACVFAVYLFGLAALLTLVAATAACVGTEALLGRRAGARTVADGSAVVTGLIYGLTLPPALPLWMTVLGGVVAVGIGKLLFGGLGRNAFNPALVGRVFLQAAFPVAMTTWTAPLAAERFVQAPQAMLAWPFAQPVYDALSGATPLAAWKFGGQLTPVSDLALGLVSGSAGETAALLILLGGTYLFARGVAQWRITAAVLLVAGGAAALLHAVSPTDYPPAGFTLFSGGLMLGAVFMATDMVASPLTHGGCWLYGGLIGALVVAIRFWSGQPEGVMYAILIANAVAPHIDRLLEPGRRLQT